MSVEKTYSQVATLDCYTEGPVVDSEGNIYFTCLSTGEIKMLSRNSELTTWAHLSMPNGQIILANGEHIICDSGDAAIYRFAKDGELIRVDVAGKCGGHAFTTPNDLVVDDTGGYYFSDSVRDAGAVYYYHASGIQRQVLHGLDYPNGLALSKDNRRLFIAESYRNRILVAELSDVGVAKERATVFSNLPVNDTGCDYDNLPDGLKLDRQNNLWVAHYGMGKLQVIDASGVLVRSIDAGFRCCSNLFLSENLCLVTGGESEAGPGGVVAIHL